MHARVRSRQPVSRVHGLTGRVPLAAGPHSNQIRVGTLPLRARQACSASQATAPAASTLRVCQDIVSRSGIRGLYRGYGLQLAVESGGYAVYFTVYEVWYSRRVHVFARVGCVC